jgi:hypothetical protein
VRKRGGVQASLEKCWARQHLAKEAHRRHLETKSQGGATCECAKGCVFERIRAVDSDSAEEACWNVTSES